MGAAAMSVAPESRSAVIAKFAQGCHEAGTVALVDDLRQADSVDASLPCPRTSTEVWVRRVPIPTHALTYGPSPTR